MRRRDFITLLGGAAISFGLTAPLRGETARVYRIGVLETIPAGKPADDVLQAGRAHEPAQGQTQSACGLIMIEAGMSWPMMNGRSSCDWNRQEPLSRSTHRASKSAIIAGGRAPWNGDMPSAR